MKTNTRSLFAFGLALLFASCSGEISLPDDAKGTAEAIISNLSENKPEVVWSALPESYRKDANEVARSAIATIDADVYDKVLGILKKANKVLAEKKEYILKNETVNALAGNKDKLSDDWDNFTDLLDILLDSELGSYDSAKNIDLGDLLANTGGDLMDKLAAISALSDEDKWIPKELQAGWKDGVAKAKEEIKEMETTKVEDKAKVMLVLNMVDGVLEQLDQAKSQEEFEAALKGIFNLVGNF